MKHKFDIGDKVRLTEGSKYLTNDDGFQLKGIGEVASVDDDAFEDYPVRVYWFENNKRGTNCYKHEDLILVYKNPTETTSQQHNSLSEQSIEEAVKTLSQAAQELSDHISVDEEGKIIIWSNYHSNEIKFDTAEKFMQYIECVKQMNKFGG